jgi:hypothetical protein
VFDSFFFFFSEMRNSSVNPDKVFFIEFLTQNEEASSRNYAMNSKGMGPRTWGSLSLVDTK